MTRRPAFALAVVGFAVLVAIVAWARISVDTQKPVRKPRWPGKPLVVVEQPAPKPRRRGATPVETQDGATSSDELTVDAAASADDARATVVVDVVSAADRKPIPGVDVQLLERDAGDKWHNAVTDAEGVARFANLAAGSMSVRASGADWVRTAWRAGDVLPGRELSLSLEMFRGVVFEGLVRDATSGRPIAGATVDVGIGRSLGDSDWPVRDWSILGRVTTADDGRFRLLVPPGDEVSWTASARGFASETRTSVVPEGDAPRPPVELRLEPSGTLRGTVRAPNGEAVAKANVFVVPANDRGLVADPYSWSASDRPRRQLSAETDASGRYEIDGLSRGGVYVAFAQKDDWARSIAREGVFATDASPAAYEDFVLRNYGTLVVHVFDADGAPAAASVLVTAPDRHERGESETDAHGIVEFETFHPGSWRVTATAPSAAPTSADVEVPDGGIGEVTIHLTRGVSIEGVVVDDADAPIAEGDVNRYDARSDDEPAAQTKTGVDGRFRFEGVRPGAYRVRAAFGRFNRRSEQSVVAPTRDVRIVLPRTASVRFRAVLPDSARPSTASIRVERRESAPGGEDAWTGGDFIGSRQGSIADGKVLIEGLDPGSGRVRLIVDDYAPVVRSIDLAPDATVDLGDVRFDVGVELAGRVDDSAGAPVVGAHVTANDSDDVGSQVATTAIDGTFRLAHVTPGRTPIRIDAPDFTPSRIVADVGEHAAPIVVRLARVARLRVTVVDAAGAPVIDATVVVDANSDAQVRTDHRGIAEANVAAGRHRVRVDGRDGSVYVDLVEGGETAVRLAVK